jgi:ribonuclease HIII
VSNPIPEDLRRRIEGYGASVASSREIEHATQYRLERGSETAVLNAFSTGRVTIQGKSSELKDLLQGWKDAREGGRRSADGSAVGGASRPVGATPRLGIDEAGKGDYFGPLVVAGARIPDAEVEETLIRIGVRDSKLLKSDERTRRISARLLEVLGPENVCVVALSPPEYEARRKEAGNVNRLLAEIDAGIIDKLKDEVRIVVVDEFARDTRACLEPVMPEGVELEVRPRAEDDVAVAAASVVARARFLEELGRLSGWAGFELPKGATHVLDAGRRVFEERGRAGLDKVAKTSFRTTEQIVGGTF